MYMKLQFLLILLCLAGFSQCFAQTQTVDFGILQQHTQRYADITIRNNGELSIYPVKVEHSPQVVYRLDKEYIRPDSAFTVRIQINPYTTGIFHHVFRLYMSDSENPLEILLTGDVHQIPDYKDMIGLHCPEFTDTQKKKEDAGEFTVTSVDAETGEVIRKSTLTLIGNGEIKESWVMGSNGKLTRKAEEGFLYFVVSHDGYETTETGIYITPGIANVSISLKRDKITPPVFDDPTEEQLATSQERIPESEQQRTLMQQINDTSEVAETITNDWLDTLHYRNVHIVFVIDVSSSMNSGEKLNLMKYTLHQLTAELRPTDQVSFVTYSDRADVYLEPVSGDQKDVMYDKIAALQASGTSSASKGIKAGFKLMKKHMQPETLNIVIVVTDGALTDQSGDYRRIIRQYASDRILFSIAGIQCHKADERKLQEAAEYGNGTYCGIHKLADAQLKLFETIRTAAFIR